VVLLAILSSARMGQMLQWSHLPLALNIGNRRNKETHLREGDGVTRRWGVYPFSAHSRCEGSVWLPS